MNNLRKGHSYLARPFWPMARRLIEMRHLCSKPHCLEPARFAELRPEFRAAPVEAALAAAIQMPDDADNPPSRAGAGGDRTA